MSFWNNELKLRHLFARLALVVLFVHFSLTFLYTNSAIPVSEVVKSLSQRYMYPAFYQDWQLLAPDIPHFRTNLFYKYFYKGTWSDWKDSSQMPEFSERPRFDRVSWNISMALNNAMSDKATRIYYVDGNPWYDRVGTSMGYIQALYFCAMQVKYKNGVFPDSVQLRMAYEITPDFHTDEKPMNDMTFNFPPQSTK